MQFGPPKIITTNLTSYLDAANPSSYPGSGTTWTDLSGNNNNFILTNGPTYDNRNGGSISFDGTDDYLLNNSLVLNYNANFTIQFWFNTNSLGGVNGYGLFFNGTTS